jgi:hypothetical protein
MYPFKPPPSCLVLSPDYVDFDVFLNIQLFYRLAGYRVFLNSEHAEPDLIVVLRREPLQIFTHYTGVVHVFDYVKESTAYYADYFPASSVIYLVTIAPPLQSSPDGSDRYVYVSGYLPVFPDIWLKRPISKTTSTPCHISNYKPIQDDSFQLQLIRLALSGHVRIFGARWQTVHILASPLSYLSANRLLSQSCYCFGLMYPYQRGRSLSGRMWQAPINGCYVLSESGTNIFDCPGVIEANDYFDILNHLPQDFSAVSSLAVAFWSQKTTHLASDLNLSLINRSYKQEVLRMQFLLLRQHIVFLWEQRVVKNYQITLLSCRSFLRRALRR